MYSKFLLGSYVLSLAIFLIFLLAVQLNEVFALQNVFVCHILYLMFDKIRLGITVHYRICYDVIFFLGLFLCKWVWFVLTGTSVYWKWWFLCLDVSKKADLVADNSFICLASFCTGSLLIPSLSISMQDSCTVLMCWSSTFHRLHSFA